MEDNVVNIWNWLVMWEVDSMRFVFGLWLKLSRSLNYHKRANSLMFEGVSGIKGRASLLLSAHIPLPYSPLPLSPLPLLGEILGNIFV
jgi:hypothetical protein